MRTPGRVVALAGCLGLAGCGPSTEEIQFRGITQYHNRNYTAAMAWLGVSLERDPENGKSLCYMGHCHMALAQQEFLDNDRLAALRELDKATFYYDQAISAEPGLLVAVAGKNQALELRGEYEKALKAVEEAGVIPTAARQIALARELEERGRLDEALVAYKQAVAMEGKNPAARAALGRFYGRLGRTTEALAELRVAYSLDPTEPGVRADIERLMAEAAGGGNRPTEQASYPPPQP